MKTLSVIFFLLTFNLIVNAQKTENLKTGFDYLNMIRENPAKYSSETSIDLSDIGKNPALKWNDTLAKVAQEKAEDMIKRSYFDHVDPSGKGINILISNAGYKLLESWTSNPKNNYFESIAAGEMNVKASIVQLIFDGGAMPHEKAGHRVHLLGLNEFYSDLKDIGIGYAEGGKYGANTVIIIAKHK